MDFNKLNEVLKNLVSIKHIMDSDDIKVYNFIMTLEATTHNINLVKKFSDDMMNKYII